MSETVFEKWNRVQDENRALQARIERYEEALLKVCDIFDNAYGNRTFATEMYRVASDVLALSAPSSGSTEERDFAGRTVEERNADFADGSGSTEEKCPTCGSIWHYLTDAPQRPYKDCLDTFHSGSTEGGGK